MGMHRMHLKRFQRLIIFCYGQQSGCGRGRGPGLRESWKHNPQKSALNVKVKQFHIACFMYINERMNRRYDKPYSE